MLVSPFRRMLRRSAGPSEFRTSRRYVKITGSSAVPGVKAMLEADKVFAGSIPENYDRYMVPLIFAPFAADLARRAAP